MGFWDDDEDDDKKKKKDKKEERTYTMKEFESFAKLFGRKIPKKKAKKD